MSLANRALCVVAVVLMATLPAAVAGAARLPDPVHASHSELRRVGAGELRFMGRPIYQASLWTPAGRFDGYLAGEPVALSLWYQREFSRADLLRITATAWRLLGDVPSHRRDTWLAELDRLWSDVAPGDNLTTVVVSGQATRFYDAERFLGQVDDPDFGPAFLSIWLDHRSVVDELRVQLLGSGSTVAHR
ncbi:MAG TPA: chalcone isomerase family protein [Steroidobacteraceae bacterium]|nr:chalcone isomerase family protein [Steroidobacteraceae bacterium]